MTRYLLPSLTPLAILAIAGCTRGQAEPVNGTTPLLVRTAPVTVERLARPVRAAGTLALKDEVTLSFKIGGIIARVAVNEGDQVRHGQLLAALDLAEIDAAVRRATSAVEKAERDLDRARALYADSVATLEQVQNAETALDVARTELTTATFNRQYARIVAPASGTILRRHAEPGELVTAGAPVLTLGSSARGMVMRAGLADRDVVRVQRGDSATVTLDALPHLHLTGVITEVGASADPMIGTYGVEVRVPRARGLASGMMGHVEIHPSTRQAVALMPIDALLEADGDRGVVFVLAGDGARAERREVTIAFVVGDRVAVRDGLDGVREVITEGAAYLEDGQLVRRRP
ncbi:MAG TPA: efflux RND transporter periplasmic adaptor subunit [Gemmatimonadaceae bacterium]